MTKKKVAAFFTAAALCGALAVGSSMAYLTDHDSVTNKFSVGKVDIVGHEPNYTPDNDGKTNNIVPTQVIKKDPQIENVGKNDAYVYLDVSIPIAKVITVNAAGNRLNGGVAKDTELFSMNNVSKKWVSDDKKIQIDDNIMKWVDDSKKLVDAGETGTADLWSDDWKKGFYPEGKVFSYFGPAWLVNFSMAADESGSIGNQGGWGAAQGPQGFFWGGTWICAAAGTDNADLVKDIMLKMTTDDDIMKDIVVKDDDFVNNSTVMDGLADGTIMGKDDKPYTSTILGGQNPLPMYIAGVKTLDLSNLSAYDQGCNEEFQKAMKDYFEGNCDKDTAIETFKKAVIEKYPDISE